MKHKKIKELLPLYIDNGLTTDEKEKVEQHLKECRECQEELQMYRENSHLLSSLDTLKAPAGFVDSIKKRLNQNEINSDSWVEKIKNIFSFNLKIPAGIVGLAVIIVLISITGLPEMITNNNYSINNTQLQDNNQLELQEKSLNDSNSDAYRQRTTSETYGESETNLMKAPAADNDNNSESMEQKIIKTANLTIESRKIDTVHNLMINFTEKHGGYISSSRSWINHDDLRFDRYQLKVPAENFNNMLEDLTKKEVGNIISRSISGRDVTEEYLDLETRLENLSLQEERYRQLLEKTDDVEDILKVENELNRIRTEIERLKGRKKYLDNRIDYSTITVEFREPVPLGSASPGIIRTLKNAVQQMVAHFYRLIILTGTLIPYLALILIVYLIYRKNRKV